MKVFKMHYLIHFIAACYHHHQIIIIVSFMQGIYKHIPETYHVPRDYTVAAILSLLFMVSRSLVPVLVLLFFYVSTFRSMCAVPNMAVYCHGVLACCLRIF
jgi:hypothetical protein